MDKRKLIKIVVRIIIMGVYIVLFYMRPLLVFMFAGIVGIFTIPFLIWNLVDWLFKEKKGE